MIYRSKYKMKTKFVMARLLALALVALTLGGCETNDDVSSNFYNGDIEELNSEQQRITNPQLSTGEIEDLVAGNTDFALDLYQQVHDEPGNLFYSPFSISIALAMAYAGARNETAQQIEDTLHFTLDQDGLHNAFNFLDRELADREVNPGYNADDGFKLRVTNAIWGQVGEVFVPEFLDTLALNYGAGMNLLDFMADPEHCRLTINSWVEDQTMDRIKDLLPQDSITKETRLVLTNAIYFKAAWNMPFEPENTAAGEFHLLDGGTVSAEIMRQEEMLPYAEGDGFAAVELPYDGEKLSMVVIVPEDLEGFEAALSADGLQTILDDLQTRLVTLSLPKFSFEFPLPLTDVLQAMGMPIAFSAAADFTGIRESGGLMITDVIQKAFVAINEEGTEAAAATAVVLGETYVPDTVTLTVDRPFMIMIRDRPTGTILFIGRVVDPTAG